MSFWLRWAWYKTRVPILYSAWTLGLQLYKEMWHDTAVPGMVWPDVLSLGTGLALLSRWNVAVSRSFCVQGTYYNSQFVAFRLKKNKNLFNFSRLSNHLWHKDKERTLTYQCCFRSASEAHSRPGLLLAARRFRCHVVSYWWDMGLGKPRIY